MRRPNSTTRILRSLTTMEFSKLQPRSAFLPPHKTQLPPRFTAYSTSPNQTLKHPRHTWAALAATLFLVSALFYVCSRGKDMLRHSDVSPSPSQLYGVVIDAGSTGSRVHVFKYGDDERSHRRRRIPVITFDGDADSVKTRPGLSTFASSPERAGDSILELVFFAKQRIPESARGSSKIYLMATAGLRRLDPATQERILESCRKVLRFSGFLFKDSWASIISGPDEGLFAWVAANYAFGTLGDDPKKTVGIIELGGASAQVTFVPDEVPPQEFLQRLDIGGVKYELYSHSFLHFGQEAAMEALLESLIAGEHKSSFTSVENGVAVDPCTPRGYTISSKDLRNLHNGFVSGANVKYSSVISGGNFTECKKVALALLQKGQDECIYQHCRIGSAYIPELRGKFFATENFFYTSEFFRLLPEASLSGLALAGHKYCGSHWEEILNKHSDMHKEDLLKYCFSSAYIVALLNDSLGISMNDNRIQFTNQVGSIPLDWALGAFVMRTIEDMQPAPTFWIFDYGSFSSWSLFAIFLIVLFAGCSLLRWKKPHLKTIYDLEKGRYITTSTTRVQRCL